VLFLTRWRRGRGKMNYVRHVPANIRNEKSSLKSFILFSISWGEKSWKKKTKRNGIEKK